ncbi:MAG: hypothetical protein PHU25_17765, partial [Deltaproteobacteria bacterium]|nr:hypothetical protein [Deltaproteobacteria bacterium]
MNRNPFVFTALLGGLALVLGCSGTDHKTTSDNDASAGDPCSEKDATKCDGDLFLKCDGDAWTIAQECGDGSVGCDPEAGCLECAPDKKYCDGNDVMLCNSDGKGGTLESTCDTDQVCADGACFTACTIAVKTKSYLGCKFIAVTTSNMGLASQFDQDFAVVIGNPSGASPAEIVVSRNGKVVKTATVAGGDTAAISLPMVLEVKNAEKSVVARGAAYEVLSNTPVVAYQYNPLHFSTGTGSNITYSYSNDASLLLPVHTLTGSYMASTWPTWGAGRWDKNPVTPLTPWMFYPGFVTVAAIEDGTKVTVT